MRLLAALLIVIAAGCADASESTSTTSNTPPAATSSSADDVAETTSPTDSTNSSDTTISVAPVPIELVTVAHVDEPMAVAWRVADDTAYIAEKAGSIAALSSDMEVGEIWDFSEKVSSDGEQGFLGLAFAPDGNWLYLSYTNTAGNSHLSVVPFDDNQPLLDEEQILLVVDQPFGNHNGGDIHFGSDGYLYFGLGDGGSGGDPQGNGQNADSLLGAMLRIDPVPESGSYAIPPDNPYVDGGGAPEIWLTGLRNPWRFSFDSATGDLWIGDVGQGAIEEIDLVTQDQGGANLGWNECEGDQGFNGSCDGFRAPIHTYTHDEGVSVTGGYVYRGQTIPQLRGQYIFADFLTATLWGLDPATGERHDIGLQSNSIAGFAEDPAGELWVLSVSGAIQLIVSSS